MGCCRRFARALCDRHHAVNVWLGIGCCAMLEGSVNCIVTLFANREKYSKWELNCLMLPHVSHWACVCCQQVPVDCTHCDCDGGGYDMMLTPLYHFPPDPSVLSSISYHHHHHHHTIPAQQRRCLAMVTLGNHEGGRACPSLSPPWIAVSLSSCSSH